jgi:NAD(P)-dependent dehydrogenase (short-subunit alcohol dehydrogenase family)
MGVLDGRVCLITGAGRGIGREHALLFAREGAKVVVNDLGGGGDGTGADATVAESVVEEITAAGGQAVASNDSVADWAGARRMVDTAVERYGDLHVVVNNAGIVRGWSFSEITREDFDAVLAVNLTGTFNVTRWAASYWRQQAEAGVRADRAIVNTSSGAGLHGTAGQAHYAASKAGVAAMTLVNAVELADYGVRANCVAPIARSRLARAVPGTGAFMDKPVFDPANISPLVAALAAEGSPFTGQVFSVLGGSVGIYAGWSIAEEVHSDDRWTPDRLIEAMNTLPRDVEVRSQKSTLIEALR